ncbi:MAG: cation:proton antiporter, partial [Solirubrobacterales bacterium]|nr:cation:proton antiporter [Solirubrobacterales bacterium]
GEMALSFAVGIVIGGVAAAVLWVLLRGIQRAGPRQSVAAALMTVTAAVVVADLIRQDSGYVAASAMGIALANQHQLDVSRVLEFQGAVVKLLIGILFVLISASVTPSTVTSLLPDGLALIAIMVLVVRPLVVAWATRGSTLNRRERAFMGWLDPRGIVAAATASSFGPTLASAGVSGARDILPIAFIAIFGTVAVYGLTAGPVAAGSDCSTPARSWFWSSAGTAGRARSPSPCGTRASRSGCGPGGRTSKRPPGPRGWTRATLASASIWPLARPSSTTSPTRCC